MKENKSLLEMINNIDDSLIEEAAHPEILLHKKKRILGIHKIGTLAACMVIAVGLVAAVPYMKASEKNERTSIAVETAGGAKILFRQIAGYIARRIVCYAEVGEQASQCSQVGFIKFGSRMDVFIPLDSQVNVKVGENVVACETVIAKLN